MDGRTEPEQVTLKQSTLVSYSAMALGPAVFLLAINVMMPQLYAKELGLDLTKIGVALLLIRVFDSATDQAVGFLSDRTRTRFGARKPWVVMGIIVSMAACYAMFNPPAGVTLAYFVVWRVAYDFGWTLYNVTYTAWGAELSRNYADRSKITGYSQMSANAGVVLKNILPIILFWAGAVKTSAYTMQVFGYIFWILLPIVVVATLCSVLGTPNTVPTRHQPSFRGLFGAVKVNKPFWVFIIGYLTAQLGGGMLGLLFTFYDSYLKLGPYYPYLMMGFGVVTVIAMPVWVRIANRIGKHRAYAMAMTGTALTLQSFWFLNPAAHSQSMVALLGGIVLFFISAFSSCAYFAPYAVMADVVDYGTWRTGVARTGSYFALMSLIQKVALAVGGGVAFMLLGAFHYSVRPGANNVGMPATGLLISVLLIPGIMNIIAAAIIWRFPLTRRRHDALRRRIAARGGEQPVPLEGPCAQDADGLIEAAPAV
jgi:GPH family glycoside/pentoside/hexuronide:cation symporter